MTVRFRSEPEASAELDEAVRWYEDQRPGLGGDFLEAIDTALSKIRRWPLLGSHVPDVPADLPVRRVPVPRFPYHIVYLETPEAIRILAFAHDRRLPGYWLSRTTQ